MIVNRYLVLLILISLLNYTLNHLDTFKQVIISVGSYQYIEWFIFIDLFSVVDATLKKI